MRSLGGDRRHDAILPPGWPPVHTPEAMSPQRRLEVRGELGVPVDRFLVMTTTDLVARARPEDVVMVADRLRDDEDVELLMVGEGPLESHVVDLMGYLDRSGLRLQTAQRPERATRAPSFCRV